MTVAASWKRVRPYRWAVLGASVVVAAAALLLPRLLLGPRVPVLPVRQADFVQTVVASGHVESPHRVDIGAQLVGAVRRVPVEEGQAVKAGQLLVELHSDELEAAARQSALAVRQAQARLRQLDEVQGPVAAAALRQAEVTLANARTQLQRQEELHRKGFIGEAALDDARKAVALAEAQQRSQQAQWRTVGRDGSDRELAQAALAQAEASSRAAQARLGYARIVAPADGVLISRDVEPGDVVQPGKALMTLSPSGGTELVVQIDEKNVGLLSVGQPALASADAFAKERFPAELVYINPGIDAQRGSVEVKLRVASPPAYLKQDMTVSVDIQVARHPKAVVVASEAVRDADGARPWTLVVEGRQVRRRELRLGLRSGGVSEVMQGLRPGEQVLPAQPGGPVDGARVRAVAPSG